MGNNNRVAGPRCIALVGPFASGKTTLLEAILARTGAITRQSTVAEKHTVGDASPEARAHQMSVEVNVAETEFMGDKLTFFDCPGSIEFAFEGEGVLAGVDLAVVVAEADEKKIPALQVILKTLEDHNVPRILFLNKVDKADASVRETLKTLQPASGVPLVLRHIPMWQDSIGHRLHRSGAGARLRLPRACAERADRDLRRGQGARGRCALSTCWRRWPTTTTS